MLNVFEKEWNSIVTSFASSISSALGAGVKDFAVGDAVFAVCDTGQEQAYAEKVAIRAAIVAKKPERLTHAESAALALIGLTALCAIEDDLQLKSGETILIQGGAGGVASFAIQVAKHIGARVITTGRAENHDYLTLPPALICRRTLMKQRHNATVLWQSCEALRFS